MVEVSREGNLKLHVYNKLSSVGTVSNLLVDYPSYVSRSVICIILNYEFMQSDMIVWQTTS